MIDDNDWKYWGNELSPAHPMGRLSIQAIENVNHFECPICHNLFEDDWEFEEHLIDESGQQPDDFYDYDYHSNEIPIKPVK